MHQHPNKAASRRYAKQQLPRVNSGGLCEVLPISSFSAKPAPPPQAAGSATKRSHELSAVLGNGAYLLHLLGAAAIWELADEGLQTLSPLAETWHSSTGPSKLRNLTVGLAETFVESAPGAQLLPWPSPHTGPPSLSCSSTETLINLLLAEPLLGLCFLEHPACCPGCEQINK